nr:alpha/beta fold hydrolase [Mycolicibacterium llatzerense]
MLHGGGQNRHSWKNTGQILADAGFHVVALDSRGHGDSDRSPPRTTRWRRSPATPCR